VNWRNCVILIVWVRLLERQRRCRRSKFSEVGPYPSLFMTILLQCCHALIASKSLGFASISWLGVQTTRWPCWRHPYVRQEITFKVINWPVKDAHATRLFIARQHTDARYWYSKFVRPSVCPSVRYVPALHENGLTCCHTFFTVR